MNKVLNPLPAHPDTWPEGVEAIWLKRNDEEPVKLTRDEVLRMYVFQHRLAGPLEPPMRVELKQPPVDGHGQAVAFYIATASEPFVQVPYSAYREYERYFNEAIRKAMWAGRRWQAQADGVELTEG